ncbi:MAG: histidine phosphatase family protein [Pseudomonadota bacterium]
MSGIMRYLTHPQVAIDPAAPVSLWSLSKTGIERTLSIAASENLKATTQIVSSCETKATETAEIISKVLGIEFLEREGMHENDRTATGYLPAAEFEAMADLFFAHPERSIRGWERAIDAKTRIVAETMTVLDDHDLGDILLVGHGAVGTLLYTHFADKPIDRKFDQPSGGGNYFTVDLETLKAVHHWRPMETLLVDNSYE